jgi:ribosomal protein L13E
VPYTSVNMKTAIQNPIVKRWIHGVEKVRIGRGYSKPELLEVGLTNLRFVIKKGIPVDVLRTSKYRENIEQLKSALKAVILRPKRKTVKRDTEKKKEGKRTVPSANKKRSIKKKAPDS